MWAKNLGGITMDENTVVSPAATPDGTTSVSTPAVNQSSVNENTPVEKTFTQAELDEIIKTRLTKAERKYAESLKKLGIEDESKIDDIVKVLDEHKTLKAEYETLKQKEVIREHEGILKNLNVDDDFIDYVLTKVPVGDKFEERAAEFIKNNPKIVKDTFRKVDSGLDLNGGAHKKPEDMTDLEYIEYRRNFGLDGKPLKKTK